MHILNIENDVIEVGREILSEMWEKIVCRRNILRELWCVTGLFFHELNVKSFLEALDKFRVLEFNKTKLRANAMKFSRDIFKKKTTAYFHEKWSEHKDRQ